MKAAKRKYIKEPKIWVRIDFKYKFDKNWVYSFIFQEIYKDDNFKFIADEFKHQLSNMLWSFKVVKVTDVTAIAGKK